MVITAFPLTVISPFKNAFFVDAVVKVASEDIVFGLLNISPALNSEPVIVALPPNDTEEPFIVIEEFANLAFAIEPANLALVTALSGIFAVVTASSCISAVAIPSSLIVTAPEETEKLSLENDATPLLLVDASSPAIVISSPETEVSIPSPPEMVNVSPKSNALFEPLSAETVIVELDNELLPIFDIVLLLPLIVLLVNVSVVSFKSIHSNHLSHLQKQIYLPHLLLNCLQLW